MKNMMSILMGWFMTASCVLADDVNWQAQERSETDEIQVQGVVLDRDFLWTVTSAETSEEAFVMKVAPLLATFSREQGVEACGALATNEAGEYGMVITTNRSQIACLIDHTEVPEGFKDTGMTLHSHPADRMVRLNAMDKKVIRLLDPNEEGRSSVARMNWINPDGFSQADLALPQAYVVLSNGQVLRHRGHRRTIETLSIP